VRTARFVDEDNRFVTVDYGLEEHVSTFMTPSGTELPFKSKLKVRVELPDGTRFVAYQNMSGGGLLYKTDDGAWEYFEEGLGCLVAERVSARGEPPAYEPRFRGLFCAQSIPDADKKKMKKK